MPLVYRKEQVPGSNITNSKHINWHVEIAEGIMVMLPIVELISKLVIGNRDHVVLFPQEMNSTEIVTATHLYLIFKVINYDNVHPNAKGQEFITELLYKEVTKNGSI